MVSLSPQNVLSDGPKLQLCAASIFLLFLSLWGYWVWALPEKEKQPVTWSLLLFCPWQKKQSEFLQLFFYSDFVLFHPRFDFFSLLCKLEIRCSLRRFSSLFRSLLGLWRTEKRQVKMHSFALGFASAFVSWIFFIPIVNTTKMMTATPRSIARQLSSIERRPYFFAPSISPVWRILLD